MKMKRLTSQKAKVAAVATPRIRDVTRMKMK